MREGCRGFFVRSPTLDPAPAHPRAPGPRPGAGNRTSPREDGRQVDAAGRIRPRLSPGRPLATAGPAPGVRSREGPPPCLDRARLPWGQTAGDGAAVRPPARCPFSADPALAPGSGPKRPGPVPDRLPLVAKIRSPCRPTDRQEAILLLEHMRGIPARVLVKKPLGFLSGVIQALGRERLHMGDGENFGLNEAKIRHDDRLPCQFDRPNKSHCAPEIKRGRLPSVVTFLPSPNGTGPLSSPSKRGPCGGGPRPTPFDRGGSSAARPPRLRGERR